MKKNQLVWHCQKLSSLQKGCVTFLTGSHYKQVSQFEDICLY